MCGGDSSPQSVIKNTSRMTYFFLFIITVVGAWVFRYTETPELCATSDIFWWVHVMESEQTCESARARRASYADWAVRLVDHGATEADALGVADDGRVRFGATSAANDCLTTQR